MPVSTINVLRAVVQLQNERTSDLAGYDQSPIVDGTWNRKETKKFGTALEINISTGAASRSFFAAGLDDADSGQAFGTSSNYALTAGMSPNNNRTLSFPYARLVCPLILDMVYVEQTKRAPAEVTLDYLKNQVALSEADHADRYGQEVIHGSASPGFVGLRNIISEDGTASYGGVTRSSSPALIGVVCDASDVAGSTYSTGTLTSTAYSNVLTGSGTTWTANHVGKKIVVSGEERVIIARSSNTSITINRPFTAAVGAGLSYVIKSKFDDVARFGAANATTFEKLDYAWALARGKADAMLVANATFAKIASLQERNEYGITEDERKKIGFKGFHNSLRYRTASVWVDEKMPESEVIGFKWDDLKIQTIAPFDKLTIDDINQQGEAVYNSSAEKVAGAKSFEMITLVAFGTGRVNQMFKVTNLTA